jgi:hypothetical protein
VNKFLKVLMTMGLLLVVSCSNEDIPADAPVNGRTDVANPPKVNVRVAPPKPAEVVTPVLPGPVLPPPVVPVPPVIPILGGDERHGGNSDDDNSCNDQDSDGVCDDRDKCADFDDAIDPDGDGSPGQLVGDLVQGCDCEPENALVGIGTLCSSTTECAISTCDAQGSGVCIVENAPFGANCGNPDAGECDADDQCDGQGNCIAELAPNGIACGNAALDVCDVADTCLNGECIDNRASAETVCRPVAEGAVCDVEELCDGTFITCPADTFVAIGTVCRAAASECDQAEACTGGSATCPVDSLLPDGSNCGDLPLGVCDFQDQCEAGVCTNRFASSDYICRTASDEECDIEETCTGVEGDVDCPPDVVIALGTPCGGEGSDQEICSTDAQCTGGGFCIGALTFPDGTNTDVPCNVNNGEQRCEGTIFCEAGVDVCADFEGTPIECTEQIFLDPNEIIVQNHTLAAADPTLYGYSVAIYGDWAAVGNASCSDGEAITSNCQGFVYIYKFDPDLLEWAQFEALPGFIGSNHSGTGWSVDMYRDLLIVGQVTNNGSSVGGFRIYRYDNVNETWNNPEFTRTDTGSDRFGTAVSIYSDGGSRQYAVAGSQATDLVLIYIYNYLGTNQWNLVTTTQGASGIGLGNDVKVRGDTVIASAPTLNSGFNNPNGRIKVWHRAGNGVFNYSYDVDGTADGEGLGDFRSGNSLALDQDTGRFFAADRANKVKVFRDDLTSAALLQTITNGLGGDSSHPGNSVTLNGSTLLLGRSSEGSGAVDIWVTDVNNNVWTYQETITPNVAEVTQFFGWSISANQGKLVVGGPAMDLVFNPVGNSRSYFYRLIP